ncbi:tyrosine-type recombinase/integrase [Enterobacter cloacae complex sp. P40RS]|uniref:Tyrosine-type recombinase/integrase n=1 Tax=Enterobacter pasteurii TaxID=3029761 RepID=A0ABR9Q299_9ENTR|nr:MULTISPECIES: tyrosine-type recombinase/integrase [Enterobacter cloacae complex]MBE4852955.1 tyrosine-type recombinase/integrase [Enterobacter pasteurii]MBE4864346.1 tyrosine-type recombinase/integrase [Enterobacter cloacae complex sp. P40C2]MBE4878770.1 tyrosine-type recombinase/integrase [Enterobacter cloacae complex sp. P40C]
MNDSVSNGMQFQISQNPVRNVHNFKAGTPGERYLDFKELQNLLTLLANEKYVLPTDVHALIELGIYTCGQRPSELCHLQKSRFNLEQNKIVLAKELSKTGFGTIIFVCDKAKQILDEQASRYPESDYLFPNVNYEEQLKIYNKN